MFKLTSFIDIQKKYKVSLCCGYYFAGERLGKGFEVEKVPIESQVKALLKSLQTLQDEVLSDNLNAMFVLLNDGCSVSLDEEVKDLFKIPYLYIELDHNHGVGQKENILQTLSSRFSEFFFRFDSDVQLRKPIIGPVLQHFGNHSGTGMAVLNAGFLGGFICRKGGPEYVEISHSAVGNGMAIPTSLFNEVGYADINLRYYEDVDMALRIKASGRNLVMLRDAQGGHKSTGAHASSEMVDCSIDYLLCHYPNLRVCKASDKRPKLIFGYPKVGSRRLSPSFLSLMVMNRLCGSHHWG